MVGLDIHAAQTAGPVVNMNFFQQQKRMTPGDKGLVRLPLAWYIFSYEEFLKEGLMRMWLAFMAWLWTLWSFNNPAVWAADLVVSGVITNWKEVLARVPPSAYLQLVKLEKEMRGTTDAQGLSAFVSDLPKIPARPDGSFRVTLKDLAPGEYIVALQRAAPRKVPGSTLVTGTPILVKEGGQPLIIKVPETSPLNVGKVVVAVKAEQESSSSQ